MRGDLELGSSFKVRRFRWEVPLISGVSMVMTEVGQNI